MLDPMLGKYAAPIPFPSLKRYHSKTALSMNDIDTIDAIIFSHDHYDHLDYFTIKNIKHKVKKFIVPYGLGNHLVRWGVQEKSITELNVEKEVGSPALFVGAISVFDIKPSPVNVLP